jgi:GNAT superfamily N-acetyltransferase
MSERFESSENEPNISVVDGVAVGAYLTAELKDRFMKILVTANQGGVFDPEYYRRYRYLFEHRVRSGKITLLLVDGQPAALGAVDVGGKYRDGRTVYEMGNLVVLPEFEGQGYASNLMKFRFEKIRTNHPTDPIMITTQHATLAKKCADLGMKSLSYVDTIRIRNPKQKFPDESDPQYKEWLHQLTKTAEQNPFPFKSYLFDPLEGRDK